MYAKGQPTAALMCAVYSVHLCQGGTVEMYNLQVLFDLPLFSSSHYFMDLA